ncbi:hypothetical protein [Parapedobacter lycopersici]|uniref:hypothetical protein n=1 Tax=Parapedobacter lycopersici TaxID=1864939 RepID=UPI00333EEC0F
MYCCAGSACKKIPAAEPIDPETLDELWTKLAIPGQQRGVSAIYGNIDDTLVVATMYMIYLTTDQGNSWQLVVDAGRGISGFARVEGELNALDAFTDGEATARTPFLYSTDHGKTWTTHGKFDGEVYDNIKINRKRVLLTEDQYYWITPSVAPVDESTGEELAHPDEIHRHRDGGEYAIYFPSARRMNYLYLDNYQRLYVGTEGTRFVWSTAGNNRTFPTHTDSAFIYIGRKPVGVDDL